MNWSERNRRLFYFIFCLAYFGTLTLCILHFTIFWGKEVDVWKIRRIFSLIHDDWYVCRPALKVSVKLCLLLQRLTLSCQSLWFLQWLYINNNNHNHNYNNKFYLNTIKLQHSWYARNKSSLEWNYTRDWNNKHMMKILPKLMLINYICKFRW